MPSPKLLDALPQLVSEGLITAEQGERIRARYAPDAARSGNRMLLVFAVLGCLLVGLGIILIIAHNWDDLPRTARTVLAFVPVLLGQFMVWFGIAKKPENAAWREGPAVLLACGLCACVALISQIYHISGNLEGYLFTCSLLILPLIYLPGSLLVALGYIAMATWYGWIFRFDHGERHPWLLLVLLVAAVPFYFKQARTNGMGIGFWWLSLFMALGLGMGSQLFHTDWEQEHTLGLVAMAAAFTLVPWLHPGKPLRTWPWVFVGGLAMLIAFFVFSFLTVWDDPPHWDRPSVRNDLVTLIVLCVLGTAMYVFMLRRRKPFEGYPYPEGWGLFALCYAVSAVQPVLAAVLVNVSLLLLGVITVKHGTDRDSLRRMNLGLAILSITILLRFFDTDMSFVLRGLVFIGIGCGFLYMNLRMVRARNKQRDAA